MLRFGAMRQSTFACSPGSSYLLLGFWKCKVTHAREWEEGFALKKVERIVKERNARCLASATSAKVVGALSWSVVVLKGTAAKEAPRPGRRSPPQVRLVPLRFPCDGLNGMHDRVAACRVRRPQGTRNVRLCCPNILQGCTIMCLSMRTRSALRHAGLSRGTPSATSGKPSLAPATAKAGLTADMTLELNSTEEPGMHDA